MMSRKHYEAIAKALHTRRTWTGNAFDPEQGRVGVAAIDAVAHDLAATFKNDNPRFQYARFLKACGAIP